MHDLFDDAAPRRLPMEGADVVYHPSADLGMDPDQAFLLLREETPWEQRSIRIQGRDMPQPRLVSWHGDAAYGYSGLRLAPNPWTPLLETLRDQVSAICGGARFNSVLLNLYLDGRSSIGMHADDERELGPTPTIASISLGAERVFDMRRKDGAGRTVHVPLRHGSVLVMAGQTQRNWKHGIAKTREEVGERINLTFRLTS